MLTSLAEGQNKRGNSEWANSCDDALLRFLVASRGVESEGVPTFEGPGPGRTSISLRAR